MSWEPQINAALQQLSGRPGQTPPSILIVRRSFLACHRPLGIVLQLGEPVSETFSALDRTIELFLLANQNVAQVLQSALEMGNPTLKIIKSSGLGHDVTWSRCSSAERKAHAQERLER